MAYLLLGSSTSYGHSFGDALFFTRSMKMIQKLLSKMIILCRAPSFFRHHDCLSASSNQMDTHLEMRRFHKVIQIDGRNIMRTNHFRERSFLCFLTSDRKPSRFLTQSFRFKSIKLNNMPHAANKACSPTTTAPRSPNEMDTHLEMRRFSLRSLKSLIYFCAF